ncbi:hypothetical protein [Acinetobacter nectaris]|uniref:hypothetical protein n=1 Tax=Acinetobacter nectaris TaxID=1219382 RepID=UPI001F2C48C6|nr:hypothetical protein [Acinetobacter nectaris]MCF9045956.1 hypothetical protein [Acinetobacter nectaris]
MANIFQKIAFNQHNYQQPDDAGHAIERNRQNYIGEFGVGHESWNFNLDQVIDGSVHGYMKPDNKKLENELHTIIFYYEDADKNKYIVGYYKNCKYLGKNTAERKTATKKLSELTNQRINEVYQVCQESKFQQLKGYNKNKVSKEFKLKETSFKLKVQPKDVFLLENPIPFSAETFTSILGKQLYNKFGNYNLIPNEKMPLFLKKMGLKAFK